MHNAQNRLPTVVIAVAATLIAPANSQGQQTQVPYTFKEVIPRTRPLAEQRPGNIPEQLQIQAPARLDFPRLEASGSYVAELQRTRVDLLEKKIDLLEKRLIELESRRK